MAEFDEPPGVVAGHVLPLGAGERGQLAQADGQQFRRPPPDRSAGRRPPRSILMQIGQEAPGIGADLVAYQRRGTMHLRQSLAQPERLGRIEDQRAEALVDLARSVVAGTVPIAPDIAPGLQDPQDAAEQDRIVRSASVVHPPCEYGTEDADERFRSARHSAPARTGCRQPRLSRSRPVRRKCAAPRLDCRMLPCVTSRLVGDDPQVAGPETVGQSDRLGSAGIAQQSTRHRPPGTVGADARIDPHRDVHRRQRDVETVLGAEGGHRSQRDWCQGHVAVAEPLQVAMQCGQLGWGHLARRQRVGGHARVVARRRQFDPPAIRVCEEPRSCRCVPQPERRRIRKKLVRTVDMPRELSDERGQDAVLHDPGAQPVHDPDMSSPDRTDQSGDAKTARAGDLQGIAGKAVDLAYQQVDPVAGRPAFSGTPARPRTVRSPVWARVYPR